MHVVKTLVYVCVQSCQSGGENGEELYTTAQGRTGHAEKRDGRVHQALRFWLHGGAPLRPQIHPARKGATAHYGTPQVPHLKCI